MSYPPQGGGSGGGGNYPPQGGGNYPPQGGGNAPPSGSGRGGYPPQDAPPQYGGQQGNNPYGQPQGQPQGQPYGQPQGQPYGQPQGGPYGQPGQPYGGQPQGNPYGQPQGNPYGGQPYGQPQGSPYGQGAVPPYGAPAGMPEPYGGAYGGYAAATPAYAGFWIRFLASFIDGLIVGIPVQILASLLGLGATTAADGSVSSSLGGGGSLLSTVVSVLYGALFLAYWNGQTPGKKICRLRVLMEDGGPVAIGPAFVRALVAIVSGIALGIGYLWMIWDPKKQTWHDKAAKTIVVKE